MLELVGLIALLALVLAVDRGQRPQHRTTDPTCIKHRRPRTPWGLWWFNRNRGRACYECFKRPRTDRHAWARMHPFF